MLRYSKWIKIELAGLVFGIVALLYQTLVIFTGAYNTALGKLVRPESIGGITMALSAIAGLLALILFVVNLIVGNRSRWWLRLLAAFIFIVLFSIVGSVG